MEATAQAILLGVNLFKAYSRLDVSGVAVGWIALGMFGAEQLHERAADVVRLAQSAHLALVSEGEQRMFRHLMHHPVLLGSD